MDEKEQKLLSGLSKLLGNPEVSESVFSQIEIDVKRREKEKKILEGLEKAFSNINTPSDKPKEAIVNVLLESPPSVPLLDIIEEDILPLLDESTFVDVVKANSKKVTQPTFSAVEKQPVLPEKDFVTKSVETISKAMDNIPQKELPQTDEIPLVFRREMDLLKKSVMDLHSFASRTSQMAGGGGAGSVEELDFRTILVTNSYTANNKDYYIGVNCSTACTITLPNNKKNGRHLVVKDESGLCSINNITVVGSSIDNDTTAVMGINNMALHFVYRNGWRII
jgi:hypothetical protein